MQLSFDQIIEELENMEHLAKWAPERCEWIENEALSKLIGKPHAFGPIEVVEHKENSYDEECNLYTIYHFKDHGVYIKFSGYYSSYNGLSENDPIEVMPAPTVHFIPVIK